LYYKLIRFWKYHLAM